jgi:hypothetical protein
MKGFNLKIGGMWHLLRPFIPYAKDCYRIIKKENVNLEDASLLYFKMTIASYDAVISVFHAKFTYALIRPVTYIRSVQGKPTWLSLPVTPQTPSYPDEMAATAASVEILESYFGKNYAFTDSTNKKLLKEWHYNSLDAMLTDIEEARVSGGTNFRFSMQAGIWQGRFVERSLIFYLFREILKEEEEGRREAEAGLFINRIS